MILIIDTNTNNLTSVINAFDRLNCKAEVDCSIDAINNAKAIILPGVGAFKEGMNALREKGIDQLIRKRVLEDKVPILGICLGMQLLTQESHEHGTHQGLGLIEGNIIELKPTDKAYKVPNIGWCETNSAKEGVLFPKEYTTETFYYIHSYHFNPVNPEDVAATIPYSGQDIPVAIERDNIFGVQFHPEKSQDSGLDLLKRFLKKINLNSNS